MPSHPTLDELLALDLLTLRDHTERAGDTLDPAAHAEVLRQGLALSSCCAVYRGDRLAAHALLELLPDQRGFVRAFNIHPGQRTSGVIVELLQQVSALMATGSMLTLHSHVYATNAASLRFHRRLGFQAVRSNGKAVEFVARREDLVDHPTLARLFDRRGRHPASGDGGA